MAPKWRTALSLDELLAEINRSAPHRSKASDGTIGNAAHQKLGSDSDHNPWVKDGELGVVTAEDFTHDPAHGFDAHAFADWLRRRCKAGLEKRVKYVISNRRIASPINQWEWRPYRGDNPHDKHTHVSVLSTKKQYDNKVSWKWGDTVAEPKPTKPATAPTSGPGSWPAWKYTKTDAAAIGNPKLEGTEVAWSALLRYPPAVARLRREQTAAFGAISELIRTLGSQLGTPGGLSLGDAEAAAQRGAELALDDLARRMLDDTPD